MNLLEISNKIKQIHTECESGDYSTETSQRLEQLSKELKFRQWARDNYEPNTPISQLWHPSVRDECAKINKENPTFYEIQCIDFSKEISTFTHNNELFTINTKTGTIKISKV